jgi:hypothetical protein
MLKIIRPNETIQIAVVAGSETSRHFRNKKREYLKEKIGACNKQ